jgi:AmmeMemoRadiSam system protein A
MKSCALDDDGMSDADSDTRLAAAAQRLPEIAREAISAALSNRAADIDLEAAGPLAEPAPVFVTLRSDGRLRGCIGSLVAIHEDVVAETMDRARAAAFEDPRFQPLSADELPGVAIEVSILRPLQPVGSVDELDPARFGIELRDRNGRRAVLLPGIDGVDTVEEQIKVTRQKAGIPPGNELEIRKFTVVKVAEADFSE